jgi:hypothetical protein
MGARTESGTGPEMVRRCPDAPLPPRRRALRAVLPAARRGSDFEACTCRLIHNAERLNDCLLS